MKLVIQRVSGARVDVDGKTVGAIGRGLMVLVGVQTGDTEADALWLAKKTAGLRIFPDDEGVMNRSVVDVGGEILAVSQFTLLADCRKGNRPSYIHAAGHDLAVPMYDLYCRECERLTGRLTARGVFGADMQVSLVNDGPVTIVLDSKER